MHLPEPVRERGAVNKVLETVKDPEIPVLTIEDMGIVRAVDFDGVRDVVSGTRVYVAAGTVNGASALTYRADRVGSDTVLARIIRMVEEAQGAKLPIQAAVDRVTRVFVPAVMAVAALTFAAWMIWGPGLGQAVVAAVAVLIIACPCAMGLATPTSIMVGTGRGAEMGVLFRRGDALQALQGVDVVAFDKTGTLTEGRPELVALIATGDEGEALALAAAAEAGSEHPIAHAILRAAEEMGLILAPATGVSAIPGFGLEAQVAGRRVLLGAERLMTREGIGLGDLPIRAEAEAAKGRTPLYLAADGQALALLIVADRVKPTTSAALDALHQRTFIAGDQVCLALKEGFRIRHIFGRAEIAGHACGLRFADRRDLRDDGGEIRFHHRPDCRADIRIGQRSAIDRVELITRDLVTERPLEEIHHDRFRPIAGQRG